MQDGRRRSGFTLIELLVVIAIIAILAAILFPVFARVREKARQISCLSHMKQVGTAVLMYVGDYDGYWPNCGGEWGTDAFFQGQGTHYIVWFLDPYVKNKRIYECPSDRYAPTGYGGIMHADKSLYSQCGTSFQWIPQKYTPPHATLPIHWTGPVIPSHYGPRPNTQWVGRNAGSAKSPAEFPLVADTLQWHYRLTDTSGDPRPWYKWRRNVWFSDGHAAFMVEKEFERLRDEVVQYTDDPYAP